VEQFGTSANSAMTFYGQEKVDYNAKLCMMNMAVHGLNAKIVSGNEANSFYNDHFNLNGCCDYVMANRPNEKWLTDITEFSIPAGKVYLSPMIDCFDGMPVSWRISVSSNGELVNGMLEDAIIVLSAGEKPTIHAERGCHYRWPGWIQRMDQTQLRRSMSRKGCSPDNSACEGFFGRMKNEMF